MSLLSVNLGGFDTTFAQYIATTKYEVHKGLLYQLRHWLVSASKYATWNKNADIPTNPDLRLVAWLMSSSRTGGARGGQRKPYRYAVKKDGGAIWRKATTRQAASGKHRIRMQFYNRAEARKFARNNFLLRHRASKWIGSFLYRATQEIRGRMGGEMIVDANRRAARAIGAAFSEVAGSATRPDIVSVRSSYDYARTTTRAKQPTITSSSRVESHLMRSLNKAKAEIVPNMEQKIKQVLASTAKGITR